MRRLVLLFAVVSGILGATLPLLSSAQDDAATLERRLKAANIYKFASYVEWPENVFASPTTPIIIGVMGDDAMVAELTQVTAGRSVESRALTVRRVRTVDGAATVHVLFVAQSERARLPELKAAGSYPVLIITETEGALDHGSMINFVLSNGRVRFEVALDNAERRNLKLSSRLLTVAQFVRTGTSN